MFLKEIRHAARMLVRAPGFTAVAALSVALGIGINSALFSFHDAILFRPLPVNDPAAVVTLNAPSPSEPAGTISYPNYRDVRDQSRSFDGLVAHQLLTFSFSRSREAVREMRLGMMVSDNFFDVLGIQPSLGRRFAPAEGLVPGRDAVVVLGYDFWKNALGGDPSILNQVVLINGVDFAVIGVAPASFTGMDEFVRPAFFVPLMMAPRLRATAENLLEDRTNRSLVVKGRLKSGVPLQSAQEELTALWRRLDQQYPEANRNRTMAVRSELQQRIQTNPNNAFLIAMMTALAAVVLMIACANVANLMLGRARSRTREIAVRLALGVSRTQLIRQLLTESLMLALLGGVLGLGFAYGGIRFFAAAAQTMVPTDIPVVIEPQLDMRVLGFSLLAALASALLFGLTPAWQSLHTELVPSLKGGEAGQTSRHRTIGRNALVVAQVALSMVLLVAAGTLQAGFRKALTLNPGFRTDHLMVMTLDTSHVRYNPDQTWNFYRVLVDRARAVPGVVSVALASSIPLDRGFFGNETVVPEGYQFPPGQENVSTFAAVVDENYFGTVQTEIARGRVFTADDRDGSRRVTIVNEEFAKRFWPDQDAIGKRMRLSAGDSTLEVIGVARNEKYSFIFEPPTPFLYLPFAQQQRTQMSLLVETVNADASALAGPLREVVRTLNVSQPISSLRTFASFYRQDAIAPPLLVMRTVTTMGLVGLTLALVGLYGLVTYSVARRTREIGIRMAIGAARRDVLMMVLRQGLMLSVAGVFVGGLLSLAVVRLLIVTAGGFGAPNPATYIIVPIMLSVLTLLASYFPARRASQVDPLRALRYE
jgi:macrolide transport system ATP-binding/permease protein